MDFECKPEVRCEGCESLALRIYESFGRTLNVCERCLARLELQDAWEERLPFILELEAVGHFDAAFVEADNMEQIYRARDQEGWLRGQVAAFKAQVLAAQGHTNEALVLLRQRANDGIRENSDFLVNQLAIANLYTELSKPEEAISALRTGLDFADGNGIPTALSLLGRYASLASKIKIGVSTDYLPLFQTVLNWWGIDLGQPVALDDFSLGEAVLVAVATEREANKRFEELSARLQVLRKGGSNSEKRSELVKDFVNLEKVGFYRKMALQLLAP